MSKSPSDKEKLLDYVQKSDSVEERVEICKAYLKKFDTTPEAKPDDQMKVKWTNKYDDLDELKVQISLPYEYLPTDVEYKKKLADKQAMNAFAEKLLAYTLKAEKKDLLTNSTNYDYVLKILKP